MKKQNLKKELSPILENEHMQIGTFKANREINSYSIINNNINIIRDNIKFWQNYDGTKTQKIIKLYRSTPELIKFVREHANDYNTLNRKDVPRCINIDGRRSERYFSVYIEKFGNVRFDEVLRVFPLLPKAYLNE